MSTVLSFAPIAVRAFQHRDDIVRLIDLAAPVLKELEKARKDYSNGDPLIGALRVNAAVMAALEPRLSELEVLMDRVKSRVVDGSGSEPWTRARYQAHLRRIGLYSGDVDGQSGPLTEDAVKAFQRMKNLTVDGEVGPATAEALIADGA